MTGRVDRDILALAVPSIVSNITTPLLGLMDVALTGHMGSATYIAAIAVGGTIFNMIYWMFGFLRMGTSGLTAQAYGRSAVQAAHAGRTDAGCECSATLLRGMLTAVAAGLMLILLHVPVAKIALGVMDVEGETARLTGRYFMILCFGAPAVLGSYVFTGWFLGMQNAKAPMWVSIIINVVNLGVSAFLVIGCGMRIDGVAVGTLVAQWTGFTVAAAIVLCRYRLTPGSLRQIFDWERIREFFRVNADIFLRTVCLVAVTVWFTRTGASQGTVTLAVNTLMMQFFMFFSYFMDGFAFAGEALTGKCIGASDRIGLVTVTRRLLKWGIALGIAFSVIYFAAGDAVVGMLTSEDSVVAASSEYMGWVVVIPMAGFASFTFDGIFIGATLTRQMLVSMFVSMTVFFVVFFLTFKSMGNHGLWLAFILYLVSRGAVLFGLRRKVEQKISYR